jgi:DNA-binding LacI/PurR family transcriptional regulator
VTRLKDIAEKAGVSVMTVSKALRDQPDLAESTKERIRVLAKEMGYVPNISASGLRSQTTRLIGLIVPAVTDPVCARAILAIEQAATEIGYEVLLAQSMGKPDREESAIRRMMARRVDGLLLAPVYRMDSRSPIYEELQRRKIPTVIFGHRAAFCAGFAGAESDDTTASESLTRHLLELGHRRIAFFAGPRVAPWAQERLEGYRRAHRNADVPVDDRLIFNAGTTAEDGTTAALQFIQERPDATAIQAVNDLVAIGAAETLLSQGIRIPQEMSIVGFGNLLVSEHFRVPLTTVRQPKFRLGTAAMEMLQKGLKGESMSSRKLAAELEIRQSSAPPPSAT